MFGIKRIRVTTKNLRRKTDLLTVLGRLCSVTLFYSAQTAIRTRKFTLAIPLVWITLAKCCDVFRVNSVTGLHLRLV